MIQVVRFPEGHHGSLRKKTTRWKSMTSEKRDNYFFGQNGQKTKLKLSGFDFFFFLFPKLLRPRWKGIVIKSFWGFKEKKKPRSASAFLCNLGNIDAMWKKLEWSQRYFAETVRVQVIRSEIRGEWKGMQQTAFGEDDQNDFDLLVFCI